MAESSRRRWGYAARFTLAVFAVFSILPIWTAWYFSSWEGLGVWASFWTMLASIPRSAEHLNFRELVLSFYGPEVVKLTVLVAVSLGVGRKLAGWSGRRA